MLSCGVEQHPKESTYRNSESNEVSPSGPSVPASTGFSWIVPGELAAMPLPGRYRSLDHDAAFLEQEGIRLLVSLTEEPPDRKTLDSHAIEQAHIPVTDFTAPSQTQMAEFVALVEDSVASGDPVGVHCTAGLGRSGTMAAAYLVSTGVSADDAITAVRRLRPGSIETEAQENAIRQFGHSR
jgi:atypical dual specificity phosphatase